MKQPCFRPGIGIYEKDNEVQIELYSIRKKLYLEVDKIGLRVIQLLDGSNETSTILEKIQKIDSNYDLQSLQSLLNELKSLGLIYDVFNSKQVPRKYKRLIDFLNSYPSISEDCLQVFERVQNCKVLVIGCGSLGTSIIENLARCGIKNITIYDNDRVSTVNICNQSIFTTHNVGQYKVEAIKEYIKKIDENILVNAYIETMNEDNSDQIVSGFDFVFSCADFPSIREVSHYVSRACEKHEIPYLVGGGYSGHRGALGMMVIPGKSYSWEEYLKENQLAKKQKDREMLLSLPNTMSSYPLATLVAAVQISEFLKLYANPEGVSLTNSFNDFYLEDLTVDKIVINNRK